MHSTWVLSPGEQIPVGWISYISAYTITSRLPPNTFSLLNFLLHGPRPALQTTLWTTKRILRARSLPSPPLCVSYSPPSVVVPCSVNTHGYIILTSVLFSFPSSCPITLIVMEVEWAPQAFFFLFPPFVIVTNWNQIPTDLILSTSSVLKVPLSLLQKLLKSLYVLAQKSIMNLVLLDVSLLSNVLSNQLFLCQFTKNIKRKL